LPFPKVPRGPLFTLDLAEVRVAFRNAGFSRSAALREPRAAARFFGHRQRKKY